MSVLKPNEKDIAEAYFHGLRVGGDPESLRDMGYVTDPDEALDQFAQGRLFREGSTPEATGTNDVDPATASKIGRFFCGDCLRDIAPNSSCKHARVNPGGSVRIID